MVSPTLAQRGRRWRARLKTLHTDRNGRVTLPGRARIGGLRQAPLISRVFPELYGIPFALLAETAGDTGPRTPTVPAAEPRARRAHRGGGGPPPPPPTP